MATLTSCIVKTPDVCGGNACVRGTRIPIWGLVEARRLGRSNADLLRDCPSLQEADLEAAWEYAAANAPEIERALWENEACMIERIDNCVPAELVRRGLALGLSSASVCEAFEPPLTGDEYQAALSNNGMGD